MRIKRFNENQQYLTEPYDPETITEYKVDIIKFKNIVLNQIELIALKLGLDIYWKTKTSINIKKGSRNMTFNFKLDDDIIRLMAHDSESEELDVRGNKIEDMEEIIKKYFNIE